MAKLEDLIAFRAMLELLKERSQYHLIEEVYNKCKAQTSIPDSEVKNFVSDLYSQFTTEEISDKISELICDKDIKANVKTIFQTVENLHKACPHNLGDWYFTGNYPTVGGNRVVNRAFINFYEGNNERAY
jgi:amidophosphoribosyltransferase